MVSTAKVPHKWEYNHDAVGYNFRISNLNAALGCAQLEQLEKILSAKRELYKKYFKQNKKISEISLFKEPINCKSNYWLQTLILSKKIENKRNFILEETNKNGILTRPAWNLLSELQMYSSCPKMDLSCSKSLVKTIINIPSSPKIELNRNEKR